MFCSYPYDHGLTLLSNSLHATHSLPVILGKYTFSLHVTQPPSFSLCYSVICITYCVNRFYKWLWIFSPTIHNTIESQRFVKVIKNIFVSACIPLLTITLPLPIGLTTLWLWALLKEKTQNAAFRFFSQLYLLGKCNSWRLAKSIANLLFTILNPW